LIIYYNGTELISNIHFMILKKATQSDLYSMILSNEDRILNFGNVLYKTGYTINMGYGQAISLYAIYIMPWIHSLSTLVVTTLCFWTLSVLKGNFPNIKYIWYDKSQTGTCQKTCELELIDYLLCNGKEYTSNIHLWF